MNLKKNRLLKVKWRETTTNPRLRDPTEKKKKDFEIQPNFLRPTFFEVLFYVPNAVGLF